MIGCFSSPSYATPYAEILSSSAEFCRIHTISKNCKLHVLMFPLLQISQRRTDLYSISQPMPLRNCLNIYEILAPSRPSRTNSPTNSSQQSSKYLFKTKMSRAHKLVTSHAKTYTNGFPFSNGNPFTSRFSSVQLKFASVRTAWVIRSKRKSARSNGCVIRSQKLPNRSNG